MNTIKGMHGTELEQGSSIRPVRTWHLVVTTIVVAYTGFLYLQMYRTGEMSHALFQNARDELPVFSRLMLSISQFAFVLLLIGLVPLVNLYRRRDNRDGYANRRITLIVASLVVALLLTGANILAMYQAVTGLAAQVG